MGAKEQFFEFFSKNLQNFYKIKGDKKLWMGKIIKITKILEKLARKMDLKVENWGGLSEKTDFLTVLASFGDICQSLGPISLVISFYGLKVRSFSVF